MSKLRELRIEKNLSQSDLAKIAGVTQQQLSSYETGESNPRLHVAKKIADYFNKSIDEIFFCKNTI